MSIKQTLLAIALGLSLAACQGFNTTQKAATACTGVASVTTVLTAANKAGKISPDDKVVISAALDKVARVCEADTPPTEAELKNAAIAELMAYLRAKAGL